MSKQNKVGRPKKEVAHDPEAIKEYIERLFTVEQEIRTLREDKKILKDEFKDKVDMKEVDKLVQIIKAQLKLSSSEETQEEISDIIRDKIGMVL